MPGSGFDQTSQSFTSFRKFGFHFTAVISIALKDQEVAFKTEITNLLRFEYSLAYLLYFSVYGSARFACILMEGGTEEPSQKFGKSVTKMTVMHA